MSTQAEGRNQVMYWIHVVMTVGLMASGFFMPGNGVITPYGMQALMIFCGLMWGWIFWNLTCPSFLAFAFLTLTQFGSAVDVMKAGLGSEIVLIVLVFSAFGSWATECGLCSSIANWMLSVKSLHGKPWLLIGFIFLVTYVVAFLTNIYVTIFTFWPVLYTLAEECGYQKRDRLIAYLLVGVAYIVSLGGMIIKPYGAWSVVALNTLKTVIEGATISYNAFMMIMIPASLVSLLAYIAIGRFVLRLDVSKLRDVDNSNKTYEFTKDQKICLAFLILLAFCVFAPSYLPTSWAPIALMKKLGTLGIGIVMLVLSCTVRLQHENLTNMVMLFQKGTPWEMVWLLSANTPVASALLSADGGVRTQLQLFGQHYLGGLSPMMFIVALLAINLVLTQFAHNTVLLMVLTPVYLEIGLIVGVSPYLIPLLCSMSLCAAMATPGASSRSGLIFGNTTWIGKSDAYLLGFVSVVSVIAGLILMVPLGLALL